MRRILSGIKPTGNLTLGNYIGALKHFKDFQDQGEVFIFIADLHALTLPIDPTFLNNNTRDIACFYLASGLDPKKTTIILAPTLFIWYFGSINVFSPYLEFILFTKSLVSSTCWT